MVGLILCNGCTDDLCVDPDLQWANGYIMASSQSVIVRLLVKDVAKPGC